MAENNEQPFDHLADVKAFAKSIDPATGQPRQTVTQPKPEPNNPGPPAEPKATETVVEGKTATTEVPKATEGKPAETAPKAEEVDWKETVKKVDRVELLKEMGLDEFDMKFLDFRKSGGDPYKYLEAKTRDWSKIPDEDILKQDLKRKYPELDAESLEILSEKRLKQQYGVGEDFADDKEKQAAALELKLEADRLRKQFAEEDKSFDIPAKEKQEDNTQAEAQQQLLKQQQEFLSFIEESEVTKKLLAEKKITVGEGEEAMNLEADPSVILDYVTTPNKFFTLFSKDIKNDKGEVTSQEMDLGLLYKAVNYAINSSKIEKGLIDYGKSLGIKSEVEEINNLPKETAPSATEKKESLREALEKRGRDVIPGSR